MELLNITEIKDGRIWMTLDSYAKAYRNKVLPTRYKVIRLETIHETIPVKLFGIKLRLQNLLKTVDMVQIEFR